MSAGRDILAERGIMPRTAAGNGSRRPRSAPVRAVASKPEIELGTGPATIRAVAEAINGRQLPDVYVSAGQVVHVEEVSGAVTAAAGDEDSPLPVTASEVKPDKLALLLANHTYTYKVKTRKGDGGQPERFDEEATPVVSSLAASLASKTWPGLPKLLGIAGAPVLRPDGTLLQERGYDEATGLYLASKVPLDHVPDKPTTAQVEQARTFLLDQFLPDFPWVEPADRANYLGVLVTPILRRYLHSLIPFVVFTATMPGSGKTILTSGPGMLYGQRVLTWTHSDEELRKSITSVLADPVGTVIFDNLAEGTVIDSPVLARLITDRTWADRLLGGNKTAAYANDRLWCATGNNLRLGGDMASRTVMVRLNPDMPRPEERDQGKFAIPNLDQWVLNPANQRQILWHLLVLVLDWTRSGSPRCPGVPMRQFSSWVDAIGGFLAHHGVEGFLANAGAVRDSDDGNAAWTAFLARWHKIYGDQWKTANEVILAADAANLGHDEWDGLFLTDGRGKLPSSKSFGRLLVGQADTYHGSFVLRHLFDRHNNVNTYRVEVYASDEQT